MAHCRPRAMPGRSRRRLRRRAAGDCAPRSRAASGLSPIVPLPSWYTVASRFEPDVEPVARARADKTRCPRTRRSTPPGAGRSRSKTERWTSIAQPLTDVDVTCRRGLDPMPHASSAGVVVDTCRQHLIGPDAAADDGRDDARSCLPAERSHQPGHAVRGHDHVAVDQQHRRRARRQRLADAGVASSREAEIGAGRHAA